VSEKRKAFNRLQQLDQYPKINEDFYSRTLPGEPLVALQAGQAYYMSAYALVSGNWSTSAILMHWKGRFLDFGDLRELLLWV
jgi:hypothetical protein